MRHVLVPGDLPTRSLAYLLISRRETDRQILEDLLLKMPVRDAARVLDTLYRDYAAWANRAIDCLALACFVAVCPVTLTLILVSYATDPNTAFLFAIYGAIVLGLTARPLRRLRITAEILHRAALLLAQLGDPRGVIYLCYLWKPYANSGRARERNTALEIGLESALDYFTVVLVTTHPFRLLPGNQQEMARAIRSLLRRGLLRSGVHRNELTEQRANLFLSALHFLACVPGAENQEILKAVATLPVSSAPVQTILVETAAILLIDGPRPPAATAPTVPGRVALHVART